ncbi:MAG: hypothetical protein ABIZ49_07635 [Opitutaceae bacterium]
MVDLVEDALRMNVSSLLRHDVELVRDFQLRPTIETDKHQVLQILVNLLANAKQSCDESGRPDKRIVVRTSGGERSVAISVTDNGVSIPVKELGGSLNVRNDGSGCDATFVLELPAPPPSTAALTTAVSRHAA